MTQPPLGAPMLKIRNELVTQSRFDFGFTVVTDASQVRIETRSRLLRDDNGRSEMLPDPAAPSHVDQLVQLHQCTIDADCHEDGTLVMRFSDGFVLQVGPDPHYEAWDVESRRR